MNLEKFGVDVGKPSVSHLPEVWTPLPGQYRTEYEARKDAVEVVE